RPHRGLAAGQEGHARKVTRPRPQHPNGDLGYFGWRGLPSIALALEHHVWLEHNASQIDIEKRKFGPHSGVYLSGHVSAHSTIVIAVHEHLRFDDWHNSGLLAGCGVARQCAGVGPYGAAA